MQLAPVFCHVIYVGSAPEVDVFTVRIDVMLHL